MSHLQGPATEKQLNAMKSLRINFDGCISKQGASDLIRAKLVHLKELSEARAAEADGPTELEEEMESAFTDEERAFFEVAGMTAAEQFLFFG